MPKPYKLTRPYPLPPDAEILEHDGKPHVRLRERGKAVLYRVSKDGKKFLRPSKRWYFDIRGANGVRRVKGFTDLKATEQLAAETERKASRVRAGFTDPAEEHARRPLADHLKDYAAALEAKGNCDAHNQGTIGQISALLSGCGAVFLADVDPAKVSGWLNTLRRDDLPVTLPAGVDAFTPSEAARILGLTRDGVRRAVAHHRLAANGNGKARRLPRATVQALADRAARGVSPATVNHYIRAVRGFFRWLVRANRIGSNPLETLSLVNVAVDLRRIRRELTAVELGRLFVAARDSAREYRGLSGEDRYFLYLVAAGTGFRANALANLTPADFDLGDAPTVTLAARFAKNRKTKVQPLPADVAAALRNYLAGKPVNAPVWGGTWATDRKGAEMLRIDLDAAGIPYAVDGPDGPEYADFHALRHSYLTLGGRSGIDLRTLQELAGHSTPTLTARYSHRRLYDLAGAVDKLPTLVPPTGPDVAEIPLRSTGTEGQKGVVPGVVTGGAGRHQSALEYTFGTIGGGKDELTQPQENKPISADSHQSASSCIRVSDGTRTRDSQSHSPKAPRSNPNPHKQIATSAAAGCSAGCSDQQGEGGIPDADLAALVAAWPTLPEPIKAAIRALVGAGQGKGSG